MDVVKIFLLGKRYTSRSQSAYCLLHSGHENALWWWQEALQHRRNNRVAILTGATITKDIDIFGPILFQVSQVCHDVCKGVVISALASMALAHITPYARKCRIMRHSQDCFRGQIQYWICKIWPETCKRATRRLQFSLNPITSKSSSGAPPATSSLRDLPVLHYGRTEPFFSS